MQKARGKVKGLPMGFCYLIGGTTELIGSTTERPGLGRYTRAASAHMQLGRPYARPPALAASGDALSTATENSTAVDILRLDVLAQLGRHDIHATTKTLSGKIARTGEAVCSVLADNLGWGDWFCYGGSTPTPRIDQLVADGNRFANHCVVAAQVDSSWCRRRRGR